MPVPGERVSVLRGSLRLLAGVLALLGVVSVAVYAIWPWLVAGSGPWLASPLGLDELHVEAGRPGWSGVTVRDLRLAVGGVRVQASEGRLAYRAAGLARGRLQAVSFARMTVRVDRREQPASPDAAPPIDIESLFAAVPARRVEVALLQVEVPALDFTARGHFLLTDTAVDAHLEGISPDRANGLELAARLTREGVVDLRLSDGSGAPFLRVASTVGASRVDIAGEVDLHGFALDLAAELAGLPAGRGTVSGRFATALPWPLPEPIDWLALHAEGVLSAAWQSAGGEYGVRRADVDWRIDTGLLHAGGSATVQYAGRPFVLRAAVGRLDLRGTIGHGSLALGPGDGRPYVEIEWHLQPDELRLQGSYDMRDDLVRLAQELGVALPGQGTVAGELAARLPWPVPRPLDPLAHVLEGSMRGRWQWQEHDLTVAGLDGTWRLANRLLAGQWRGDVRYGAVRAPVQLSMQPVDLAAAPLRVTGEIEVRSLGRAPFVLSHDLGRGSGALEAQAMITVTAPLAAGLVSDWANPYDLDGGRVDLQVDLRWAQLPVLAGSVSASLHDVNAHYDEYVVGGLNGVLHLAVADDGWLLQPSALEARAVELGVTLAEVETALSWSGDTVSVRRTTAEVLGGRARAEPFDYHIPTGEAYLTLDLENLDLAEILALEGDQVTGTGRLNGTLPVTVRGNAPSIDGGQVRADAPGGRLQVSSALAGGTGMPGLDFALRALQNFDYQVLQGDVAYTEEGDLTLGVRLEGRNPEVEGGRPIHYNLTVTENIPTLLRSLRLESQLTRGIERALTN
jgi:hypothetical protein